MNTRLYVFSLSQDGAVAVDWVVLTASVLCSVCMGLMSLGDSMSTVSCSISSMMTADAELEPQLLVADETGGGPSEPC